MVGDNIVDDNRIVDQCCYQLIAATATAAATGQRGVEGRLSELEYLYQEQRHQEIQEEVEGHFLVVQRELRFSVLFHRGVVKPGDNLRGSLNLNQNQCQHRQDHVGVEESYILDHWSLIAFEGEGDHRGKAVVGDWLRLRLVRPSLVC